MDTLPSLLTENESDGLALFSERLSFITAERERLTPEELKVLLSLSTGAQPEHVRAVLKLSPSELKKHAFLAQSKIGKV